MSDVQPQAPAPKGNPNYGYQQMLLDNDPLSDFGNLIRGAFTAVRDKIMSDSGHPNAPATTTPPPPAPPIDFTNVAAAAPQVTPGAIKVGGRFQPTDELLTAIGGTESGNNPNVKPSVVRGKAYTGQFQLGDAARQDAMASMGITDPTQAPADRDLAHAYMSGLLNRYGGNVQNALAAYNWGPGNMDKYLASGGKMPMPTETQNYITKTMGALGNQNGTTMNGVQMDPSIYPTQVAPDLSAAIAAVKPVNFNPTMLDPSKGNIPFTPVAPRADPMQIDPAAVDAIYHRFAPPAADTASLQKIADAKASVAIPNVFGHTLLGAIIQAMSGAATKNAQIGGMQSIYDAQLAQRNAAQKVNDLNATSDVNALDKNVDIFNTGQVGQHTDAVQNNQDTYNAAAANYERQTGATKTNNSNLYEQAALRQGGNSVLGAMYAKLAEAVAAATNTTSDGQAKTNLTLGANGLGLPGAALTGAGSGNAKQTQQRVEQIGANAGVDVNPSDTRGDKSAEEARMAAAAIASPDGTDKSPVIYGHVANSLFGPGGRALAVLGPQGLATLQAQATQASHGNKNLAPGLMASLLAAHMAQDPNYAKTVITLGHQAGDPASSVAYATGIAPKK